MPDWNDALRYGQLVQIAYDLPADGCWDAVRDAQVRDLGYFYVASILSCDMATDRKPQCGERIAFGFAALRADGELVFVLRGTETILDWIHDLEFWYEDCPVAGAEGHTEDGFSDVFRSLQILGRTLAAHAKDAISAKLASRIVVAGHSLGAAVATMAALDIAIHSGIAPRAYLFASPRVGTLAFRDCYNRHVPETYRIVNPSDLVPRVPFWGYMHVSRPVALVGHEKIKPNVGCQHYMTTYLSLMGAAAGVSSFSVGERCEAIA